MPACCGGSGRAPKDKQKAGGAAPNFRFCSYAERTHITPPTYQTDRHILCGLMQKQYCVARTNKIRIHLRYIEMVSKQTMGAQNNLSGIKWLNFP
jgi:hypothetical protein